MKRITVLASTALILLTVGCSKKQEEAPIVEPTATYSPFLPASSGQVTPLQVKFWVETNTPLDSLAAINAEALSTDDTIAYRTAFVTYTENREALCVTNGLSGGYKEYQWIAQNISNAVNRPLLDSLGLQTL